MIALLSLLLMLSPQPVRGPEKPDCHGPMAKTLHQRALERARARKAQAEIGAWAKQTGSRLDAAWGQRNTRLLAKAHIAWEECWKRVRFPELTCLAAARGDAAPCSLHAEEGERSACRLIVQGLPLRRRDPAACESPVKAWNVFCRHLLTGQGDCSGVGAADSEDARICTFMVREAESSCQEKIEDMKQEQKRELCKVWIWSRAYLKKDHGLCDRLPETGDRLACRAGIDGSDAGCERTRVFDPRIDGAGSECRKVIIEHRLLPNGGAGDAQILWLRVANLFFEPANCSILVSQGGHGREVELPEIRDRMNIHELRFEWPAWPGPLKLAERCSWKKPVIDKPDALK